MKLARKLLALLGFVLHCITLISASVPPVLKQ